MKAAFVLGGMVAAAMALTLGLRHLASSGPAEPPRISIKLGQSVATSLPTETPSIPTIPAKDREGSDLPKYRYLLDKLENAALARRVATLLARREAATDADTEQTIDAQLAAILSPDQQALYTMLRESDVEQKQLNNFAAGISAVAALEEHQQREVLLTRLRHKQTYELWERQSGLDRELPSPEERNHAHATIARALSEYRDGYLAEIRSQLNDEQFRMLSDFEHTEFAIQLERLQQTINAR